jgi:hypothetical protein
VITRTQDEQFARRHEERQRMLGKARDLDIKEIPQARPVVKTFESGATRDDATEKLDYEGFLDPAVLRRFAEYMHAARFQRDGSLRDSDNWQRGIPLPVYMKSLARHYMDTWRLHRQVTEHDVDARLCELEVELCGIIFNAQGYLSEILKAKRAGVKEQAR